MFLGAVVASSWRRPLLADAIQRRVDALEVQRSRAHVRLPSE